MDKSKTMQHIYRFFLALFFASAIMAPAAALQQEDFCSALNKVIDASKQKFENIKTGEPKEQDDFFGKVTVYQSSIKIPGAVSSTINKGIKLQFQALMATASTKSESLNNTYYSTRDKIKSCLGSGYKYEEVSNDMNNIITFKAKPGTNTQNDLYKPTITLRCGKVEQSYQVVLEVGEPFFPGK
jgi:hypothetical protein